GALLTSMDLAENNIAITKKRFKVFNLKADFILGNAEELASYFPNKQFDLVYSFGVLHHTPRPTLALNECFKVLKPGGELRIMLYAKYSIKNFLIYLKRAQPEAQPGCPIAVTFSKKEITKLLEKFEIIECKKTHIFPYRLKEYKKLNYVKKFPWNLLPLKLFHVLEKKAGWHLLIKAKKPIL
ncbi:MAG TPA: methyltransferase type 12, partial [Parachlamydiales bacterium]|nr:methyltransferase type 12 [Parachlamydiales bacterium]